jgi:trehalose 6-phosphate synthase
MAALIVVSNRLPKLTASPGGEMEIPAGGLASAVLWSLRGLPESRWFGWSGETGASRPDRRLARRRWGTVELVGMPLSRGEVDDYYHGFCNMVLWPLFHGFQDRVHIQLRQEAAYREVQRLFAHHLMSLVDEKDTVWVHDYHLLLLGEELRKQGWKGSLGFFLHTPFPPYELWRILPDPRGFLRAMLRYDLIGFQVRGYLDNYLYCCRRELDARWDGKRVTAGEVSQRAGAYPISIDPGEFRPAPGEESRKPERRGELLRVVRGRQLVLGVDRLDYTKGIPDKIQAWEHFIREKPEWRNKASFIQIASPSRIAAAHYQEEKRIIESMVGRVNGELADHNWVPIRYLYRNYPRATLARFYREADVGLITPLRDGMNLVAKEFVAAQDPVNPGVLVLSRGAGAADELPEALIVNPHIPADVAEGIEQALIMPLQERRERYRTLMSRIDRHTVVDWGKSFLVDLQGAPVSAGEAEERTWERPTVSRHPAPR